MTPEVDPSAPKISDGRIAPGWARATLGLVVGATAVSFSTAAAAVLSATSPIDAVGESFIDRTPPWLKDFAIAMFGDDNKTALRVGIIAVLAGIAVVLGLSSRTSPAPILAGVGALAVVGFMAILDGPSVIGTGLAALLIGAFAACVAAIFLWRVGMSHWRRTSTPMESRVPLIWDRRAFLQAASALAAASSVAAGLSIRENRLASNRIAAQRPSTLPRVSREQRSVMAPPQLVEDVEFITPNADFYRIDTALSYPQVDLDRWSIRIHGMVEREVRLSYQDLLDLPQMERTITLCCVSNEVGGPYIGNAVWQGVHLADVLRSTVVSPEAEQVFSTSLDGWTCGFPIDAAFDGRDAMIAIGMNGEPLPLRHGFPARLVVPGLYGYVSATKWLSDIEINRWSDARGYWLPRGWARLAPIKTQSRIDVPRRGTTIRPGPTRIAGVAWAQNVGISRVQVRIDDGPWSDAILSDDVSDDVWRMWAYDWSATPGSHVLQVRATDGNGIVQTEAVSPVAPDGATGWHTRRIDVDDR